MSLLINNYFINWNSIHIFKDVYPKDVTSRNSYIIADEGEKSAMATLFSQIAEDLPFDIKVFSGFKAAENWIMKV